MKKILIVCLFINFLGCSGADSSKNEFLGTWRVESSRGQYTVMSLKNNNTFDIDLRIEGKLSKIVDKRGSASGTWTVDDTDSRFVLNVTRGDTSIGWPEGETTYRIGQMDELHLVLISPGGREHRWEKSGRPARESEVAAAGPTITMAPLVVSLGEE